MHYKLKIYAKYVIYIIVKQFDMHILELSRGDDVKETGSRASHPKHVIHFVHYETYP